uniref:Uncharacterized protein n=1 Tax=Romanomermis culicivorax TaxID=13658 RepID=A0A915KDI0_ROMCU
MVQKIKAQCSPMWDSVAKICLCTSFTAHLLWIGRRSDYQKSRLSLASIFLTINLMSCGVYSSGCSGVRHRSGTGGAEQSTCNLSTSFNSASISGSDDHSSSSS